MLEMNPDKRATARDMLDHPWLDDVGEDVKEVRVHSIFVSKCFIRLSEVGLRT